MSNFSQKQVERQVRKELLRMRAAVQREEFCQLGCELINRVHPQQILGRFLGSGTRSMKTFKWGRILWSWHRRYDLLLSSAWLLIRGLRGRSLGWPTLLLIGLRLLRFGLERSAATESRVPESPEAPEQEQAPSVAAVRAARVVNRAADQARRRRNRRRRLRHGT